MARRPSLSVIVRSAPAGVASLLVVSQGVAVLQREEASPFLTKTLLPGEGGRGRADTAARGRSGS